jgi:hypothetical protein
MIYNDDIADARQIFHKNFFSFFLRKTPQEVKKKKFLKNLPRPSNNVMCVL